MRRLRLIIIVVIISLGMACVAVLWTWNDELKPPKIKIKIGALLPSLTGDLVATRDMMIHGMELAKEDLLAKYKGRVILDLDYEDGCFIKETVPAVQKFVNAGVSIISGSFCLFGLIPVLPMTEANKIITFNTAANPNKVLNLNYAFSTNVEVKDEAIKLAEFAYTRLGARRAVTLFLDTPFGHDYDKYFTRDFTSRGGQVVGSFPNAPDGKNFEIIIAYIKALKPDVILVAHFGVPLALFIREVRRANITVPILGNYETEDPTVIEYAGSAAEGVIFSSSELKEETPVMKQFVDRYIRKFGVKPSVVVTNSYDDIVLSVESYLKCNGDRACMASELHKVKNYQGVSGVITIKSSGATDKPTIFKMIRNRTFIRYRGQE